MGSYALNTDELVNILDLSVMMTKGDCIIYISPVAREILDISTEADISKLLFSELFVDDDPRHLSYPVVQINTQVWTPVVKTLGSIEGTHSHVFLRGLLLNPEDDLSIYTVDWAGFSPKRRRVDIMSTVVDSSPVTIVITDLHGTILYVNERFEDLTGYKREEAIGGRPSMLKSGFHNDAFYDNLWDTIRKEKAWKGTFYNKNKNGDFFWESASIQPIVGDSGLIEYYIAIKEDITERKLLEDELKEKNSSLEAAVLLLKETQAQMIQQEKMASVGQLAAGVAHEINNPLGFITSNIGTLSDYTVKVKDYTAHLEELLLNPETLDFEMRKAFVLQHQKENQINLIREDIDELLEDVQVGLERVRKIVQGLRNFSRIDQIADRSEYDVSEGIATTLIVANNELKYDAEVKCIFRPDVPSVMVNGGQINQVILNLLLNAVQAIREDKLEKSIGLILIETFVENQHVVVRFIDNGPGMTDVTLNRLFEPFYTTKPPGLGTGLGLSICYDILVNKHKGFLKAYNNQIKGATFELGLPITEFEEEGFSWRE